MDPNIITEKRVFNAETKKENSELIRVLGLYEAGLIRSTEDGHIQVYNKKKNTWEKLLVTDWAQSDHTPNPL